MVNLFLKNWYQSFCVLRERNTRWKVESKIWGGSLCRGVCSVTSCICCSNSSHVVVEFWGDEKPFCRFPFIICPSFRIICMKVNAPSKATSEQTLSSYVVFFSFHQCSAYTCKRLLVDLYRYSFKVMDNTGLGFPVQKLVLREEDQVFYVLANFWSFSTRFLQPYVFHTLSHFYNTLWV